MYDTYLLAYFFSCLEAVYRLVRDGDGRRRPELKRATALLSREKKLLLYSDND